MKYGPCSLTHTKQGEPTATQLRQFHIFKFFFHVLVTALYPSFFRLAVIPLFATLLFLLPEFWLSGPSFFLVRLAMESLLCNWSIFEIKLGYHGLKAAIDPETLRLHFIHFSAFPMSSCSNNSEDDRLKGCWSRFLDMGALTHYKKSAMKICARIHSLAKHI